MASVNPSPAIGEAGSRTFPTSGTTGILTVGVSGLSPDSAYAFKACATNVNGTAFSYVATFTSLAFILTRSESNDTIQRHPNLASYAAGSVVTLTAVGIEGAEFQGWTGDFSGATNPATITMDGNKTVTAVFVPSLAGALESNGLTYALGGNTNWFLQTPTTHYGADAAQSETIGNSQQSVFETSVTGPGNLTFWWKVSSESGYNFLSSSSTSHFRASASAER